MSELRGLFARWAQGWTAARELPAADDLGDGLRVHCRQLGREIEYFALDDDPGALTRLAGLVAAEDAITWLTVPTTDTARSAAAIERAGLVLLRSSERLMATDLGAHPRVAVREPYRMEIQADGSCIRVSVSAPGDAWAARGFAGLSARTAVPDRILTGPDHRRRGLAAAVMGALASAAAERGAEEGILVASEEGRLLYGTLGWREAAQVLIASTPGVEYPD
nr:hypothetical protein GCM10020063_027420 [Dactylosporangium thailandense]